MLTILGSLLGFAGSAIPSVLDHFQAKEKNKITLEQMKLQATLTREGHEMDLAKWEKTALDDEHRRLIEHDTAIHSTTGFFSGLSKSVRPLITYAFFGLFCTAKGVLIYSGINQGLDLTVVMDHVIDEEFSALMACIFSFWFGSRTYEKMKGRPRGR